MWNRISLRLILGIMVIMNLSCGEIQDPPPPLDVDTTITFGPEDGKTVQEPLLTFQWTGSNFYVSEFSYRCIPLDDGCTKLYEDWSEWSNGTFAKLNHLDQGTYMFEVVGRSPGDVDETPDVRTLEVDIPGPGMLLRPFKKVAILNEEFIIEVLADDVDDFVFAHLILKFDPARLETTHVRLGEKFQGSPRAFFVDDSKLKSGIADINMSTINSQLPVIKGSTETIIIISFRPLVSGESRIEFDVSSEFNNSEGEPMEIENRIGSVIEVLEQ
jgi:hypothetical protein